MNVRKLALRGSILVAVLLTWQLAGNDESRLGMPTFTRTVGALVEMVRDGSLVEGLVITNQALIAGYALALVVSLVLGVVLGTSPLLERITQPYLFVLLATPTIALVPIIQVVFGLTLAARVALVFLFAFIYMTVNTMTGVRTVDVMFKEMGTSFGATRWQMLRKIVLPAAVPSIMAGIRLGLGRAIVGMIVAELTLVGAGVGSLVIEFQARLQPAYVFAVVLALLFEGVLLMEVAQRAERRLSAWRGSENALE